MGFWGELKVRFLLHARHLSYFTRGSKLESFRLFSRFINLEQWHLATYMYMNICKSTTFSIENH